ncbi:MAG: peptidylprolyl isomerase [Candidatus Kapabacteria bacterium]|nr:peptidylprolyl isomerase [Candidatus Kapabacteria bacterium]
MNTKHHEGTLMFTRMAIVLITILCSTQISFSQTRPMYRILVVRGTQDTLGPIVVRLFPSITPLHVRNFDSITRAKRFDNTAFHRVIPGFVIQGGDPNSISGPEDSWGFGDPSQPTVKAEFSSIPHYRGRLGMARSNDVNSATSQFYICHDSARFLDRNYTVFGETMSGLNVIDSVALSPRNSADRPLIKVSMFVTYVGEDTARPSVPMPTLPVMNASSIPTSSYTTFRWTAAPDCFRSSIELSTDSAFATRTLSDTVDVLTANLKPSEGFTTYYWRVRGDNGGGFGQWSPRFTFTTGIAAPNLIEPANNSVNVNVDVKLRWTPLNGATARYHLQVATGSGFLATQRIVDEEIPSAEYQVVGMAPGKKHYWRLSSIVGSDTSIYSKPFVFTTGSSTGIDDDVVMLDDAALRLSPMPTTDVLTVTFTPKVTAEARIVITDVRGTQILALTQAVNKETETSVGINCSSLVPGLYLIRLIAGELVESRQFIKL